MAEAVRLSTGYYLDPKMVGATPHEERLFIRLMAFCGANETGGILPPRPWEHVGLGDSRKAFAGLIRRGVLAPIECPPSAGSVLHQCRPSAPPVPAQCSTSSASVPEHSRQTQLVGWANWQSNVDELAKRRKSERERKAVSRAKSRDNDDVSQSLGKGREGKGRGVSSSAARNVRDTDEQPQTTDHAFADGTPIPPEPADDRPNLSVVPVAIETTNRTAPARASDSAHTLVRIHAPGMPTDISRQLAEVVQRLMNDPHVERRDLETALTVWATRSGAGPRLLPNLVADAARTRSAPAPSSKVRDLDALARKLDQETP